MLNKLTLTNFRKHESLSLDLQQGTIVMRAANEGGKTTVIEAIAYALFGARACRQPLEEVVTWGKPAASLRVELSFVVDGVAYTVKRSKAGAELAYDGGTVTGQTEVTGFIERLLGAPAALATSLWFANQGTIRGALEAGPKATAQLIEQLADFGIVDRLIDLIQTKLTVGNVKPFEERVKQARDYLDGLTFDGEEPTAEEAIALEDEKQRLELLIKSAVEAREASEKYDREVFGPLVEKRKERDALAERQRLMNDQRASFVSRLACIVIPVEFDEARLVAMRRAHEEERQRRIEEAGRQAAARELEKIKKSLTESMWDGDAASYSAFQKELAEKWQEVSRGVSETSAQLTLLKGQKIAQGVCGMCGKDLSEVPEVLEKNLAIDNEIAFQNLQLEALRKKQREIVEQQAAVKEIDHSNALITAFLQKHGRYAVVNNNSVPPVVLVNPMKEGDRPDYEGEVKRLEAEKQAYQRTAGQRQVLEMQIADIDKQLSELAAYLATLDKSLEDYDEYARVAVDLTNVMVDLAEQVSEWEAAYTEKRDSYFFRVKMFDSYKKNLEAAKRMLAEAEKQLDDVNFNNTLLKKIRASRPVIVDRLWQVVLSAVSYYFGQMRGAASAVTRADGGFKVDGQAVEGLSGSTLDILGLSIRLALLKTFLPRCDFLVLDEPAAACDDNRESAMLGTVATAHFNQVLLITHSDIADAYANQLVTL